MISRIMGPVPLWLVLPMVIIVQHSSSSSFVSAWMGSSTPEITNQVRRCRSYSMRDSSSLTPTTTTSCQNIVFRFKRRTASSLRDVWNEADPTTTFTNQNFNYRSYDDDDKNFNTAEELFPEAVTLDFVLELHKPLGCTVDESLAPEGNGARHVFVSKVTPGGFAEAAGLRVGDVIIGLTGLFGDKANVGGLGLDQVKGLVSSRPEEEPLWIRVARGTTVMERHETALVDLCTSPGSDQKETEQCVIDFIAGGYNLEANEYDQDMMDAATVAACSDTDTECLLDDLWSNWGEDPVPLAPIAPPTDEVASKPKPKPWSSRSSPSGTYVRDPRTGKVRNIDA